MSQPEREHRRDARLTGAGILFLVAWGAAGVLIAGLPVMAGVVVAAVVPGLGGLAPGLPVPLIVLGLLVVLLLAVIGDTPFRRAVARLFPRGRAVAEEVLAFVGLWLLLRPLLATWVGALVAAAVTVALYAAAEPLLDRMAARQMDESG